MEEAFRCHAIAAIVGEFGRAKNSLDLTVPRRLALVWPAKAASSGSSGSARPHLRDDNSLCAGVIVLDRARQSPKTVEVSLLLEMT